jgi:hypothetical protein
MRWKFNKNEIGRYSKLKVELARYVMIGTQWPVVVSSGAARTL